MEDKVRLRQFHAGTLWDAWRCFGAHPCAQEGQRGWRFDVWAPRAQSVSVVGEFGGRQARAYPLTRDGGIWQGFVPNAGDGDTYHLAVTGADGVVRFKTDPYAFTTEVRPKTAGRLCDLSGFAWSDGDFLAARAKRKDGPLNIYEVHLGSWRRGADGGFLNYRRIAVELAAYIKDLHFSAVELMPLTEYPLDGSWGYQCTGYFAPSSRYGSPKDLMWFVDYMHQQGISVILDWVPAHFCKDPHGLRDFDGTSCYEYADPQRREHAAWGTRVFDYGKPEVRSFLLSSARFWLEEFHMDGLRVDAVASMLYLDFDRDSGRWTPNAQGGRENPEAIQFLKDLNTMAHDLDDAIMMIAEESSVFPKVTAPVGEGGLGFTYKWNMGWMNDICRYEKTDPWLRPFHHRDLTFSLTYAFSERYVLPISHDEVVHGKGSLTHKMPGDYETQLRSLRGFYAYMMAHPGRKLTFMGTELGTPREWDFDRALDWGAERDGPLHRFFCDMNAFYQKEPALWEMDETWAGFEWLAADDARHNVIAFLRRDRAGRGLLCAVNFSANDYEGYRLGVPQGGCYIPAFSTDDPAYGGKGFSDTAPVTAQAVPSHGRDHSVSIRIPAFGAVFLRGEGSLPLQQK